MNAAVESRVRPVVLVLASQEAPVGTFTVRRALPARERHSVGPWVFLDHFGPYRAQPGKDGVGPHPHAGIETVTYLFSGRNEHRDSAGHAGVVGAGGAQWMTAGRGVVHAERPLAESDAERTMHGIQLWTSLPRLLKTTAPRYQRIDAAAIPRVRRGGATVALVAGEWEGARGPAETLMPVFLWHLTLEPGSRFEAEIHRDFEAGIYVAEGAAALGEAKAAAGELAVWGMAGETLRVDNAGPARLEAMILGGAPAEGPLVFHGPFVMNSVEQVRAAEIAYRTGRMGSLAPG
ncbi:MAG TPA: pirin family protein [Usitatibacter sp.]|nr:pirin family protein [Usitatibacter sp.]